MASRPGEGRLVAALLLVTAATGLLDAVSLLHLGTFTGYMTGTVILVGVHLADRATRVGPGVIALVAYLAGALLGGRLVRRHDRAAPKLIGDVLLGVAVLIGAAAALQAGARESAAFGVVAMLGLAMGLQTSATRHAGVPDMALPAATMILHGLAHDSRLAGGGAERTWRRIGVLVALLGGAAAGAVLSRWQVWSGLMATAALNAAAGLLLQAARPVDARHRPAPDTRT